MRSGRAVRSIPALAITLTLGCAGTAERLVDRAGLATEREAGQRVDRGVSGAAAAAEDAVLRRGEDRSAATGTGAAAGTAGAGASGTTGAAAGSDAPRGGAGADANYDFARGERPILLEDFTRDNVGDFPRDFELRNGNWEVVEWEGSRLLRGTGGRGSDFHVRLPETLPDRFTIEFDVMFTGVNQQIVMATSPVEASWQRHPAGLVKVRNTGTGLIIPSENREILASVTGATMRIIDRPTPVRLMVDGNHVKVYAGGQRVANVPNARIDRSDRLHFIDVYSSSPESPIFIGAVRVDAGGRDLYGELEREGRVAVRGILFDTNSDRIQPVSRATLEDIGEMLREHTDLRLSIEGHTDSEGAEEYNRQLSERRAEAVRHWLAEEYGLDSGRLSATGLGEAQPVASNDTPEGRQQNRRVELVRLR